MKMREGVYISIVDFPGLPRNWLSNANFGLDFNFLRICPPNRPSGNMSISRIRGLKPIKIKALL